MVLVCLGLLVGAVFLLRPRPFGHLCVIPEGVARADLCTLSSALDEWALGNGANYPLSLEVLIQPDERGYTYLWSKQLPKDPWGHDYVYVPPRVTHPSVLMSYGADGKVGGVDDDEDLFVAGGPYRE